MLHNDALHFGLVSRTIHWLMAVLVIGMLVFGTVLGQMQTTLANYWLFGLHKTFGLTIMALVILRLIWHRISPPPAPLGPADAWTNRAAKLVHALIYILLICIPLAGWIASSATGIDVMFADRWVMPRIAPVSEAWEDWGFIAHGVLTKILMALLLLHIAGAVKRGLEGDGTLRRMTIG